jgi:hypothetical protein
VNFLGYPTAYGANGFCAIAGPYFTAPFAGAGGASNCASGAGIPIADGGIPSDGSCKGRQKPGWQRILGNPSDGVRDLPDISMFAADGAWNHAYIFCNTDSATYGAPCNGAPSNWSNGGGTSFATPIMAGIQALVNEVWGGRQGNPNPVYYAIARNEFGVHGNKACDSFAAGGPAWNCTFNDVTIGDTDIDCVDTYGTFNCFDPGFDPIAAPNVIGVLSLSNRSYEPAYKAGVGWDFTTGIGTVNAAQLVLNPIWGDGAGP